jgi:elongation factor G
MEPRSDLARLRNIGIVAHIDAGKTTVSERFLFQAGVIHRMGEVHEGTTVLDWMEEERQRGITITAAATRLTWRDCAINLIDTPGHVDFTAEVERSMRVLDGAILVVNGVAGVQAQSETVWRQLRRHGVPCIAFVNQCDRAGADFLRCVGEIERRLRAPALAIQHPLAGERGLAGVIDLLTLAAASFPPEALGREARAAPIPPEQAELAAMLHGDLVEALAERDDLVLARFAADERPSPGELRAALRRATLAGSAVPVLCGSALRNVGLPALLDAVVDYLPSPLDRPPARGRHPATGAELARAPDASAPVAALAFKHLADPNEDLTFVRVYSGEIRPGQKLLNPRLRRAERVARVLRMHADERTALERASPGDIVALSGLKLTGTGDTLCDFDQPIAFERMEFPEPVITLVVEPGSSAERDKLRQALARLEHEDPTLVVREDEETGQWLLCGMGELHLEVVRHRLESQAGLSVRVGKPRVAYREAILGRGRGAARVERALGGKEVFGAVEVEIEPLPAAVDGARPERQLVEWDAAAGVPRDLRAAVEEALLHGAECGPRFGFPLARCAIRVVGGASAPGKDSEAAFRQAAAGAMREALAAAQVAILEPVMSFEVSAPPEFASGILADLQARRALIREVREEGGARILSGSVALAETFGYSTTLRSLSQGRAACAMSPQGFQAVAEAELTARGLSWT